MYETKAEMQSLQNLLKDSRKKAGTHLLEILKPVSAASMCKKLVGIKQVAWATVSSKCEPRVSPVDSAFIHGRFYLSTDTTSLRARHLQRNPATSVSYFEDITFAVVVHGTGKLIREHDTYFRIAKEEFVKRYGRDLIDSLQEIIFVRVDPELMFAHAS